MEFVLCAVGKYTSECCMFASIHLEVVSGRSLVTNLLGNLCLILTMY